MNRSDSAGPDPDGGPQFVQQAQTQSQPSQIARATCGASESGDTLKELSQSIIDLRDPSKTEEALIQLAKRRDEDPDFAILLWNSIFTVQVLVQEIMQVYEFLKPPTLSPTRSNRACNALALLQCIASHKATRHELVESRIPIFLYPLLRIHEYYDSDQESSRTQPYVYLRLTSLGVVGALVKSDDESVTKFLLDTEYMPMGLSIIEHGNELTKIIATFVLLRILIVKEGLEYCCHTYERFSHVAFILGKVIDQLATDIEKTRGKPNATSQKIQLLNKIIRCYSRLCDNTRARKALKECLPNHLKNDFFKEILDEPSDNGVTEKLLNKLRDIVKNDV